MAKDKWGRRPNWGAPVSKIAAAKKKPDATEPAPAANTTIQQGNFKGLQKKLGTDPTNPNKTVVQNSSANGTAGGVVPAAKTTAPAPTRNDPNKPGFVITRGPRKEFMEKHPVLSSKHGDAREKFLSNHPKISKNISEYQYNAKQRALLRRAKKNGVTGTNTTGAVAP